MVGGSAAWRDAVVVASVVLSAGTYLFDFGSNVVVLVQYSTRFRHSLHREKQGMAGCNAVCRHQTSELSGYFYGLLVILAFCHSLNALLFKLKFTRSEAPLFAAYFLPLIHLYRLSNLLWRTLSCKGIQDIRSPEMNGLYCILGSAMEGVPMLILQFCGYLVLTQNGVFVHSMSTTFKVSVAAALMSAAYNGGTSVQSIAKNATTLKQKVGAGAIGGSFTLFATLSRCLTFTYVIVYIRQYFSQQRTVREQAKFHVSDTIPLLVIGGSIAAYSLYFWLLHAPTEFLKGLRNPHRLLTALAFSYMSMNLGPLYPLISQANDTDQLGSYIFRLKLLALCLLHLLLDLTALCVTNMLGTLPKRYIIVSSLTVVGYMASLVAFMKFDVWCGPTISSSVSSVLGTSGAVTFAIPEEVEDMGCPELEGVPPLGKRIGEYPHDSDLPEAKGCTPTLIHSRSLDSIVIRRDGPSSLAISPNSFDRPFRTYSERTFDKGRGTSPCILTEKVRA